MAAFKGKVVLVTGAGKGAGRGLAQAFAAQGASVAANDVTPINLDETVAQIRAAGGRVEVYVEDIAKKMPVQTLVNAVLDDWGRIDVLINAAEVEPQLAVLEMDDWDWQRTLDVNLTGAFLLTQSVGRVMRAAGAGVIVHIGERVKGREGSTGLGRSAYYASKAGLEAFAARAAAELSPHGIRVHHVRPGEVDLVEEVLSLCS